jgi:hypothetical protein
MGRISNVRVITVAVCRANIIRIVPPGAGSDDVRGAISFDPRRSVGWRTVIGFMPTILYPLVDTATHVVKTERIGLKAANTNRLLGACGIGAILAIGRTRLQLVAPPIFGLGAGPRRVFPFGLARKQQEDYLAGANRTWLTGRVLAS